jgi:hypothetical protein
MGSSGGGRSPIRAAVALLVGVLAVLAFSSIAAADYTYGTSWSCFAAAGYGCASASLHTFGDVYFDYDGSGTVYGCAEARLSSGSLNYYACGNNHVQACFYSSCADQSTTWLYGEVVNYSGYSHTIWGTAFA